MTGSLEHNSFLVINFVTTKTKKFNNKANSQVMPSDHRAAVYNIFCNIEAVIVNTHYTIHYSNWKALLKLSKFSVVEIHPKHYKYAIVLFYKASK